MCRIIFCSVRRIVCTGIKITYFEYLGVHFPILGLLKTLILGLVIIVFWADRPGLAPTAKERQPWRPVERRIAIILAAALLLWMSDIWHGVAPAWISLTAGLALIAPGLGVLSGREFESCLKLRPLIYVAGIFGLGAIAADTGLGNFWPSIADRFSLTPGADATNFGLLALGNVALGLITAMPSIPAVVAPLAGDLAAAMDVPVITVLMTTVLGFSTAIFPYQVPPLLLGLYMGKVPFREACGWARRSPRLPAWFCFRWIFCGGAGWGILGDSAFIETLRRGGDLVATGHLPGRRRARGVGFNPYHPQPAAAR